MLSISFASRFFNLFVFHCPISSSQWEKWHAKIFLFSVILLLLISFISTSVNGAKRWISLGILNFQPAEFVKNSFTLFLASYFTRRCGEVRSQHVSIFKPFIVMLVLGCFLLLQPDLGSTDRAIYYYVWDAFYRWRQKILQFVGLIALGGIFCRSEFVLSASFRFKRITGFSERFGNRLTSPVLGFQLTNSLIAFGRGEITGEGLGNSIQKLDYLPEAHTDFIMAIIGEEFGFIRCIYCLFFY